MKKYFILLLFFAGATLSLNAQIVTYQVDASGLVGMKPVDQSQDFCSPFSYEQLVNGSQWGITWTSTNVDTPSSILVEIFYGIESGSGPYPVSLNGFTDTSFDPSLLECAGGRVDTLYLTRANYNPNGLNTLLIDYAASAQNHEIVPFLLPAPGYFALVTVDYAKPDTDEDGVIDENDNCVDSPNPGQEDMDSDGVGDVCDNCPFRANADQLDTDQDGAGNVCESLRVNVDTQKMKLTNGPLFIDDAGSGIIMKGLNGSCYRLTIDLSGVLQTEVIPCPPNE